MLALSLLLFQIAHQKSPEKEFKGRSELGLNSCFLFVCFFLLSIAGYIARSCALELNNSLCFDSSLLSTQEAHCSSHKVAINCQSLISSLVNLITPPMAHSGGDITVWQSPMQCPGTIGVPDTMARVEVKLTYFAKRTYLARLAL